MTVHPARAAAIAPSQSGGGGGGGLGGFVVTPAMRVEANAAVLVALLRAIAVADEVTPGGFTRVDLAARLGISVETVNEWFKERRHGVPPRELGLLLVLPVLPAEAVAAFFNALLLRRGGGLALSLTRAVTVDGSPTVQQLLDVAAAMGRLSEHSRRCADAGSEGGCEITLVEARQELAFAERLLEEAAQLVEASRAKVKLKGGG